jgi:hypothetical protein
MGTPQANNMKKHILSYQDKMDLSGTFFSHPPRDNLKSIKLRNFLLEVGYFDTASSSNSTTVYCEDEHTQDIKTFIDDPDITPQQREILLRLMDKGH